MANYYSSGCVPGCVSDTVDPSTTKTVCKDVLSSVCQTQTLHIDNGASQCQYAGRQKH